VKKTKVLLSRLSLLLLLPLLFTLAMLTDIVGIRISSE